LNTKAGENEDPEEALHRKRFNQVLEKEASLGIKPSVQLKPVPRSVRLLTHVYVEHSSSDA
jgi:hypothetical protein